MIAIEVFLILVLAGLVGTALVQHFGHSHDRGEKGDAVKTAEEIQSHLPHH